MNITNTFSISFQPMHANAIPTRKMKQFPNNTRVKFNGLKIAAEHYPQHSATVTDSESATRNSSLSQNRKGNSTCA